MNAFDPYELEQLIASIDGTLTTRFPVERLNAVAMPQATQGPTLWREAAEMGWLSLAVSAEHGGVGASPAELGRVFESVGAHAVAQPILESSVLAALLLSASSGDLITTLLPDIMQGNTIVTTALRPHDRIEISDAGSEKMVSGSLRAVAWDDDIDYVIAACTHQKNPSLVLVDVTGGGVAVNRYRLADGRAAADLSLTAAPAKMLAPSAGSAFTSATTLTSLLTCSDSVGAMSVLNKMTRDYTAQRQQFGAPLASFQVLQHRMMDMMMLEEEARAVTQAALRALTHGSPAVEPIVAAAHRRVHAAARFVGEQAVQLHGGMGMTSELSVGQFYKRLLVNASLTFVRTEDGAPA